MLKIRVPEGPEVIYNGTVIAFDERPVEFAIPVLGVGEHQPKELRVLLRAREDSSRKTPDLQSTLGEPNQLVITLFNAANPLGIGSTRPFRIGSLSAGPEAPSRVLYFAFRVHALSGEKGPPPGLTIHYTFYLGEKVQE